MSSPTINNPPRLQNQVHLLLDHIEREGLRPGDRLSPERELAKKLGISRPSLREAIQVLQVQGRLVAKHGIGVFLLDDVEGVKLRDSLRAAQHNIEELFQMREILEAPAVEWAAERRTDAQLLAMKEAAKALNAAIAEDSIDFDKVRRLDMQFHLTIVKSAQNKFLNQTLGTLQEVMYQSMDNTLKLPGRIESSGYEHGVILDAIEKQDSITARLMIIQHIHNARDAWFKYLRKQGE
ncbi:MAG: FadR family transcriptional regulator [Actinobacteria bacterium]|jgi:GntR family transcriptional regulator, transcriptional repressor for pyruvate dehydrogenase complex|nr:FadR family transcriptional regulator [Actinomycetota bacterium]NDC13136.1 FadR family transcriptional regulator [Actinomycetota bacterium]NDC51753.1 FadR family transcriptional regulator [Actinomycetota bacterium]